MVVGGPTLSFHAVSVILARSQVKILAYAHYSVHTLCVDLSVTKTLRKRFGVARQATTDVEAPIMPSKNRGNITD